MVKMPFVSSLQQRTCFSRQLSAEAKGEKFNWDCEEWLSHTPCVRCLRKGEKIITPVHIGPRGGAYFYAGDVKIYITGAAKDLAIKKYGLSK